AWFARARGPFRPRAAAIHPRAGDRAQGDFLPVPGDSNDLLLGKASAAQGDRHYPGNLAHTRGHIFQGLAAAETAQPGLVLPHVASDLGRIGPRICAERPTDRLADEKLAVGEGWLDVRVQQSGV